MNKTLLLPAAAQLLPVLFISSIKSPHHIIIFFITWYSYFETKPSKYRLPCSIYIIIIK
jgi:hypothetical protein